VIGAQTWPDSAFHRGDAGYRSEGYAHMSVDAVLVR
jgi:hypothetical protein